MNHRRLAGRLIVDDPDGWAEHYPANHRLHGTAMASIILHGELDAKEPALSRPVYVRPILKPSHHFSSPPPECIPDDYLVVDLIHRAVKRILTGDGEEEAVAPSVRIINLSVGDPDRPFIHEMSPWARLLDWLAYEYNVLFIVSAGNQVGPIEIPGVTETQLKSLSSKQMTKSVLEAIRSDSANRRILSPAESMNALTVGASHEDSSACGSGVSNQVDPLPLADFNRPTIWGSSGRKSGSPSIVLPGLPSPINGLGLGYRRAIKPEVLLPGGGRLIRSSYYLQTPPYWRRIAMPLPQVSRWLNRELNWVTMMVMVTVASTSNAAALASRIGGQLYEVLLQLQHQPHGDRLEEIYFPVLIKALLVHGSQWDKAYDVVAEVLPDPGKGGSKKDGVSRFLGYGRVFYERLLHCTEYRATSLGFGEIGDEQTHRFAFPLPPSLSGKKVWRRLTVTLAWLTPVNVNTYQYRGAKLWLNPPADTLDVKRKEVFWQSAKRGTVQHEILEGDEAAVFEEDGMLVIDVSCRGEAVDLNEPIRYGLAVTLEVAEGCMFSIYNEIKERIPQPVRIRV
ncbi:MAG: S8 family peptidase [Nitrospirae bacterium]|nr:S8 family peptidase [Magnetococcales bacterium]